ncbi:MAG: dienelactone hydrolase family protein [Proteobacteria bacterium]|nr:dienelactone hydrolase family protein [Pseudomonadota bacterium]MDA1290781.1 dienelactone hydrolase family protein [Pseudomonadota bacterium]
MIKLTTLFIFCCSLLPITMQAQERITLQDGTVLNVFIKAPESAANQASPLVILMGGGPGNASISQDTSRWLGSGFAERGWMVAVPISPNNRSFRGGANNALIAELINELQKRDDVATGKVLLAGVSNGGMSALEIARRDPQNYFGVAAVPAISSSDTDNEALKGFPVYLRIGGSDQLNWADRFDETVTSLTDAGVVLDADVLDGAPHMFRMEWESLGSWLQEIQK